MLGGGLMIAGMGSATLHVAFQKIFIKDGEMLIGVGLLLGGAR
jgi:hypothetical protein